MNRTIFSLIVFALCATTLSAMEPAERMRFADALYLRGMHEMAAREYEAVLAQGDEVGEIDILLFRLGESYKRLNDAGRAEELYSRLLSEYPDSTYRERAALRLAEIKVNAGAYERAAAMLRALLDDDPPEKVRDAAQYYLGYASVRLGASKDAEEALREVVENAPGSAFFSYACLELAKLLVESGRSDEAVEIYERAAGKAATPRVAAEAWFQVAEMAYRAGDYETSAEAYERLLKEFPKDQRVREAQFQAASSYYQAGRYSEALALVARGLKTADDDRAKWLYLQANCERKLLRTTDALSTYEALVKDYPESEFAEASRYEKSLISFKEANYEEVILDAERLLAIDGLEDDVLWLLAESYAALARTEEAMQYYGQILSDHADGSRAPHALHRLARAHRVRGALGEASTLFDRLIKEYPDSELIPQALFETAYCKMQLDDLEGAVEDWAELVKKYPGSPRAEESLYQKALAEIRLERDEQAMRTFIALVFRFPGTRYAGEAHHWMGVIHEKAGKQEEAEAAFRKALALDLQDEWADKSRFHLAAVLQQQGKLDEAADLLQQLVSESDSMEMPSGLLEWLARYQLEKKEYDKAADAARMLTKGGRDSAWIQIGWYLLGKSEFSRGDRKGARISFERAQDEAAATREGADAALQWGLIALEDGDLKEAEKAFQQAAERALGDENMDIRARSYYGLGRVSEEGQDFDEAARYFTTVGVLFDNEELVPESLYRAAEALGELGRGDERRKLLEELKNRYPESEWAAKGSDE